MGAPSTSTIKTAEELVAAPAPAANAPDWAFEIPKSAMDSVSFSGSEADLHYSVKEPSVAQFMKLVTGGTQMRDAVVDFVREIGVPGEDGKVQRGPDGKPIMRSIGHIDAAKWFARIGTKGQMLVATTWGELFTPTADEGESMRGSRRRAG